MMMSDGDDNGGGETLRVLSPYRYGVMGFSFGEGRAGGGSWDMRGGEGGGGDWGENEERIISGGGQEEGVVGV